MNGRLPGGMQKKTFAVCYGAVNNAAAALLQSRNDSTEGNVKAREGFYDRFLAENKTTDVVPVQEAQQEVAEKKQEAPPQAQSLSFMVRKKRRKTNKKRK